MKEIASKIRSFIERQILDWAYYSQESRDCFNEFKRQIKNSLDDIDDDLLSKIEKFFTEYYLINSLDDFDNQKFLCWTDETGKNFFTTIPSTFSIKDWEEILENKVLGIADNNPKISFVIPPSAKQKNYTDISFPPKPKQKLKFF